MYADTVVSFSHSDSITVLDPLIESVSRASAATSDRGRGGGSRGFHRRAHTFGERGWPLPYCPPR